MKTMVQINESDYRELTRQLANGAMEGSKKVETVVTLTKGDYELRIEAEVWIEYGFNCRILSYTESEISDFDVKYMEKCVRLFL